MSHNVYTIVIDEELNRQLQILSIETESRKSLISFMLSSGMNVDSDQFRQYQAAYIEYFGEYEKLKHIVEEKYIKPELKIDRISIPWSLDFATREVTCYI